MNAANGLARVARILDRSSLVINKGSRYGIRPNLNVVIFRFGEEILDPDNGKSLGRIEHVVSKMVAFHVQENMTTLRLPSSNFEWPSEVTLHPNNRVGAIPDDQSPRPQRSNPPYPLVGDYAKVV
jgi:hypothetical protein